MPIGLGAASAASPPHMIAGFRLLYHEEDTNRCPACGQRQWIIGRVTAECAFCETALPLDHIAGHGCTPRFITRNVIARLLPRPL